MDENPYRSPRAVSELRQRPPRRRRAWHPITWGIVGFVAGTVVAVPLILSTERHVVMSGGMLFGGIPGALLGIGFGIPQTNRERRDEQGRPWMLLRGTAKAVAFYGVALLLALVLAVVAAFFWG